MGVGCRAYATPQNMPASPCLEFPTAGVYNRWCANARGEQRGQQATGARLGHLVVHNNPHERIGRSSAKIFRETQPQQPQVACTSVPVPPVPTSRKGQCRIRVLQEIWEQSGQHQGIRFLFRANVLHPTNAMPVERLGFAVPALPALFNSRSIQST